MLNFGRSLIKPARWNVQPGLTAAPGLWRGCVFLEPFFGSPRDLVHGFVPDVNELDGYTVDIGAGINGREALYEQNTGANNEGAAYQYGFRDVHNVDSGDFTAFIYCRYLNKADICSVFGRKLTGGAGNRGWTININGFGTSNEKILFTLDNNGTQFQAITGTNAAPIDTPFTIVARKSGSTAEIFVDGIQSASASSLSGSFSCSAVPLQVGSGLSSDGVDTDWGFTGSIYMAGLSKRAWSDAEIKAWSDDPNAMLRPGPQIVQLMFGDAGAAGDDLLADDLQSLSEVDTANLGQEHALNADDIQSASEVGTASLGQEHALNADDLQSASEVTKPSLNSDTTDALEADDLQSASEVSTAQIAQEHAISADDLESASNVTSPSIGQEHSIDADNLQSVSEVDTAALGQQHNLSADDLSSVSEVDTAAFGQEHALNADDIQSVSEVTAPSLSGDATDALDADDLQSLSKVSTAQLRQKHALNADDLESISTVMSASIEQLVPFPPIVGDRVKISTSRVKIIT